MGDAPQDFMRDRLADIVGLEIEITRVESKSKLSQNRDEGDHANVMREMEARSHDELAVAMARHRDG
jgi:transcriptional regulator